MAELKEGLIGGAVNLYFIYKFLRILTTPWEKSEAFKLGIVDDNGKILKKKRTLKTSEEKDAYTMMHRLVWKLKRLMEKVPFGKSRLASYAAALWLIKEHKFQGTDEQLQESFLTFLETDWKNDALILKENHEGDMDKKTFSRFKEEYTIKEEVFYWYLIKGNFEKGKVAFVGTEKQVKLKRHSPKFSGNYVMTKSRKDLKMGDKWKKSMGVSEEVEIDEAEIATSIGSGGTAGLDMGLTYKKKKEDVKKAKALRKQLVGESVQRTTFAGKDVFIVDSETYYNCRLGKKKYGRYEKYVGKGKVGQTIREYGLKYPRRPIILQNGESGPMLFLKYGRS